MDIYRSLVRLYPDDIRFAYGDEMVSDFDRRFADARRKGRGIFAAFVVREIVALLTGAVAERIGTFYSHRSFHGRCRPNSGVVRPPNMGKREWFHGDATTDSGAAHESRFPPVVQRARVAIRARAGVQPFAEVQTSAL